ncbi:MAG: trypsin-like peptidase domain-containing protein [Phycisphaerae bacterium]|nr:trypsin-like peptidase domain-containing protein [Phycisphaerae bacterium]
MKIRLILNLILIVSASLVVGGCLDTSGPVVDFRTFQPCQNQVCVDIDNLSDSQLTSELEDKISNLLDANKLTALTEIRKGINKKSCEVDAQRPTLTTKALPELYEQCKRSIVIIAKLYKCPHCDNWHTSTAGGFVVNSDGTVITNYHVVNDTVSETMVAVTADGKIWAVREVLAADKANDLAVIKTDIKDVKPLPVRVDKPVGNDAIVISHPDHHFYTLTKGLISRYAIMKSRGKQIQQMEITADYAKGSSGCPILDNTGAVIGLVVSTLSIYYDEDEDVQKNLQMVVKNCATAKAIKELISKE